MSANAKKIAMTVAITLVTMAVANRIAFTRNLVNGVPK